MTYLRLAFCLFITGLVLTTSTASAAPEDSVRVLIAKADDQTADVTIGTKIYRVPITFETIAGLNWSNLKDAYDIPPIYASMIKRGRIAISVTCSGTAFIVLRSPWK